MVEVIPAFSPVIQKGRYADITTIRAVESKGEVFFVKIGVYRKSKKP